MGIPWIGVARKKFWVDRPLDDAPRRCVVADLGSTGTEALRARSRARHAAAKRPNRSATVDRGGRGGAQDARFGAPNSRPRQAVSRAAGRMVYGAPASVAQWIEQSPPKRQVARSIRAGGTSPASGVRAGRPETSRAAWPPATSCCDIGFAGGDQRARRGVAAGRAVQPRPHREAGDVLDHLPRRRRGDEIVAAERPGIEPCPLHEVGLLVIVCDQDDAETSHVPVSARKRLVIYDAAGVEASRERFGYSVSAPNPGPPYRVAPRLRPVLRRPRPDAPPAGSRPTCALR